MDDGGSTASPESQAIEGTIFESGAMLVGTVRVTDLEAGEQVILRVDLLLGCKPGSTPTGNVSAGIRDADVVSPVVDNTEINPGLQNIPLKQVGSIPLALIATKTVETAFTRTYDWTIDKSVSPESWDLFTGDDATSEYTVSVDKTGSTDSDWTVSGVITIMNPNDDETAVIESVGDLISPPAEEITVDCGVEFSTEDPLELPAGETLLCSYTASVDDDSDRTNSILIETDGSVGPGIYEPVPVSFGDQTTINEANSSVTVSDPNDPISPDTRGPFTDDSEFSYTKNFTCADDGTNDNTATIVETQQTANASVTVNCYDLMVEKTAATSMSGSYAWEIDKTADETEILISPGQSYAIDYAVEVDAVFTAGDYAVGGTITISNPSPDSAATLADVSDVITLQDAEDIIVSVDCGEATTVPADGSIECTYTAELPDGEERLNTATATLQNVSYNKEGVATNSGTTDFSGNASVSFDDASMSTTDACISVDDDLYDGIVTDDPDTGEQELMYCADQGLPKIFTYSVTIGPFDEAECGPKDAVVNTATFTTDDTGATGSDSYEIPLEVACPPPTGDGCTLTQGYWKTHNESFWGGAPEDDTWLMIEPEADSTIFFSSGQIYFDVMWTAPKGDVYYILAHQYIAAELNLLNGATMNEDVMAAFAEAGDLLASTSPGEVTKQERKNWVKLAETLTDFNEGLTGTPHCSEDATSDNGDDEEDGKKGKATEQSEAKDALVTGEAESDATLGEAESAGVEETIAEIPTEFALSNYPNPFNPSTTLSLSIPEKSEITVTVYNMLGRQIRLLAKGSFSAGTHQMVFEAGDLPSGMYLVQMVTPVGTFTHQVLLAK